ncbi:alpha/beta fold hydrolase [Dyadobacter sp. 3J3]|uniref:alpha/beta fold hydrolase n=1 Tax=Dyadobacter sp. 3J3 TaxID=2606600 RepID=UPI001E59D6C8|nr:alpha/beta fold hydrolase [Dyadobacter sp. 3J3]
MKNETTSPDCSSGRSLKINMPAGKFILLAMVMLLSLTGCSGNDQDPVVQPVKTFILVHGAWQSAYVWDEVKSSLEKNGQKVIVVQLPAHGDDNTPANAVSLNVYRDKVVSAINAENGKVILVGHSLGGMVVSAVAEQIPDKLEKLIFIGAFLPADGQSLLDIALQDATSLLGPNLIPSADKLTLDVKHENIVDIFCQDGSTAVKQLLVARYKIEPAIPFADKIILTEPKFGKVNKYYIHTAQDHAIGFDNQKKMVAAAKITNTYILDSGHCPFLSMPDKVTEILLEILKK